MNDPARPLKKLALRSYGLTDPGSVRGNNEDIIHADDERGIYFVIDGMGGHAAGERAAALAKERLAGRLERPTGTAEQRLREAITLANNAIYEAAVSNPAWQGMACVLTAAVVEEGQVTVGHVGDSRLYKITAHGLEKITRDHSPVGQMEDNGELNEADAMRHPRRNEVFRDVGSMPHDPNDRNFVDVYSTTLAGNEGLLLCSDGLTDAIGTAEIWEVIRKKAKHGAAAVSTLIARAVNAGKDNVSVVLVEGERFGVRGSANGHPKRPAARAAEDVEALAAASPIAGGEPLPAPTPSLWRTRLFWAALGIATGILGSQIFDFVYGSYWHPASGTPAARTIPVSPSGPLSIAAAIAAAAPGDTVAVAPGDYPEKLQLKSGVRLEGYGAVLHPPPGEIAAIALTGSELSDVTVAGLRIAGGATPWGWGVSVRGGKVRLEGINIAGVQSGGIGLSGNAFATLLGSRVAGDSAPGIVLRDTATIRAIGNTLTGSPPVENTSTQPSVLSGNSLPATKAEPSKVGGRK